jgi:D-alanyl-D-alanine carboxypeptidase
MIEEERYIIEEPEEVTPEEGSTPGRFPVRTQLLLLASLMLLLFAGVVIPKTLALLSNDAHQAEIRGSTEVTSEKNTGLTPKKIENISLRADSVYVWDVIGQRALYEKKPDQVLPLASITKLMTALVVYELVADNTPVTISRAAAAQQSGGSLKAGETFKVKELADFALISSYNSAAYTLASTVGELLGEGDPMAQFIAAMNIQADELNLKTLKYKNPTGLDISTTEAGAVGSARDTSFLMEYILLNYPEILTPTVTEHTRLYNQKGDFHEAFNTNTILADIPNLLGSKTGYTDLAGGNLTIAFDAGFNRPIIVTVLGSTHSERFSDVKKIVAAVQAGVTSE